MEKVTEQNGFILINKRVGVTSRSVDNVIQRLFQHHLAGFRFDLGDFPGLLILDAFDEMRLHEPALVAQR